MRIAVSALVLCCVAALPALAEGAKKPAAPTKPDTHQTHAAQSHTAKPGLAQLAANGDGHAQYQLALSLLSGKGGKANPAEANGWFAMAAGNGVADAAMHLAKSAKTPALAAIWWYRAGLLGNIEAQQAFVQLIIDGKVSTVGGPQGAEWLTALANQDNVPAMLALAHAFEVGADVLPDRAKAKHWFLQAAQAGNVDAMDRLGRLLLSDPAAWRLLYKDRSREAGNTDRDRLYPTKADAEKAGGTEREPDIMRPGMIAAQTWLNRALHLGNADAAYALGQAHLNGLDMPADPVTAIGYLIQAANQGHTDALQAVATLSAEGYALPSKDLVRAWVSYDWAAAQGVAAAAAQRDDLARTMTARQLARARQVASDIRGF